MTGEYCPLPLNSTFDVQEVIGSGSFSQVYKAIDKRTEEETTIALKAYRSKKKNVEYYSHAATEMAFLRFLNHPNIIKYLFSEIKTEYMYMALEYSSYGSLNIYIENTIGFAEETVQPIMSQLMSAVCYLHSMYILHGDIKPENLIVCSIKNLNISIKLCDYGLSDIVVSPEAHRKKAGSFYYMAPEILLGFPYDYTADIFSSGVCMYEMLFGRRPFGNEISKNSYLGLIKRRVKIEVPPSEKKFLSHACRNFMKRLFAYDKQDRITGQAVTSHPFLGIEYIRDVENHYIKASECLVKGIELVNAEAFGSGYVEVNEAILHLKIHLNSIQDDDVLRQYIAAKYKDYVAYAGLIEQKLLSGKAKGPIDAGQLLQSERQRYLLKSTPALLSAYDMCAVGEMYYMQRDRQQASKHLREGLDLLFPLVHAEPDGQRKRFLLSKIDQWINIMETINHLHQLRRN